MGSIADGGSAYGNPARRFEDYHSSDVPFDEEKIIPAEFYIAVSVVLDMFVKHAQQQHYSASTVPSGEKCIKSLSMLKTLLCPSVEDVGTQTDYVLYMEKNTHEVQPMLIGSEGFTSRIPLSDEYERSSSSTSSLSVRSPSSQSLTGLTSSDLRDEDSNFEFGCADCGDNISLFNGDLSLSWDRHCQKPCHLLAVKPEERENPILVQQQCRELAKDSNPTNKVTTKEKALKWVQSEIVKMREEVNIKSSGIKCGVLATSPLSMLEHLKGRPHKNQKPAEVGSEQKFSDKIDMVPHNWEKPCDLLAVRPEKNKNLSTEQLPSYRDLPGGSNQGAAKQENETLNMHPKKKSRKRNKKGKVGGEGASNATDLMPQQCEKLCHMPAVRPPKKEDPSTKELLCYEDLPEDSNVTKQVAAKQESESFEMQLQCRNPTKGSSNSTNLVATEENESLKFVWSEIINMREEVNVQLGVN